ncbi:hypothetical protein D3C87_1840220 [compost metagenome]
MRQGEKCVDQAELIDHFKRRGMDCVAAKIPQEIRMFFDDGDIDAGPCQQKSEHQPGGAGTGNDTGRLDLHDFTHRSISL